MMQTLKNTSKKISDWYSKLPDKKKHVEFITALLSVPVMLTVIIINLNNLKQSKDTTSKQPTTAPIQILITGNADREKRPFPSVSLNPSISPTPTLSPTPSPTAAACKKQIGPVTILSPQESEIVTKDTVCINITTDNTYCSVVWSYSLNGGSWSDYTDKDICLYNLSSGNKTIQLKVKSSVSDEVIQLQRSFIYKNPSATATPSSTTSASLQ